MRVNPKNNTMLPPLVASVGRGVLTVLLATIGNVSAISLFDAPPPSLETFDPIVRSIWEKQQGPNAIDKFGELRNPLCIRVPAFPTPDAGSKAKFPLAWHLDFISENVSTKGREQQIRQLEALVKVGLLKKKQVKTKVQGQVKDATRYSLTEKGWMASGSNSQASCFILGKQNYLGAYKFVQRNAYGQAGREIYEVYAKVGIGTSAELPPWARQPEFQNEFPEIRKQLDGQDMVVLLVRDGGEWVDYQALLQKEMLRKAGKSSEDGIGITSVLLSAKREMLKLNPPPPPTLEEIQTILRETHGVGQQTPWPIPCIDLPGSEKLPVDLELFGHNPQRYSVAVFTNKQRSPYDHVANKTIPYLDLLEGLGIVTKHFAKGLSGKGRDKGAEFEGYVYDLTPAYAGRIHSFYTTCFPLGAPTVEFVDIKIAALNAFQIPEPAFRYKLKVLYRNPPQWLNDPLLRSKWEELDSVLENGMACQGEFLFDSKTRQKHSGAGSCWWAFDSYYENY